MKARELAELLLEHPDFDVKLTYADIPNHVPGHPFPELVLVMLDIIQSSYFLEID